MVELKYEDDIVDVLVLLLLIGVEAEDAVVDSSEQLVDEEDEVVIEGKLVVLKKVVVVTVEVTEGCGAVPLPKDEGGTVPLLEDEADP